VSFLVTVIGLCLAGGGYYLVGYAVRWRGWWAPQYTRSWLSQMFGILWISAVVQIGFVRFVEGRPLHSVGLQFVSPIEFGVGVVIGCFVIAVLAGLPEGLLQRFGRTIPDQKGLYILAQPIRWKVATALTVGITEVVLFYGYFMERSLELTGSPLWAISLATVVAGRSHLPRVEEIRVERIPIALAHAFALALLYLAYRNVFVVAGAQTLLSLIVLLGNSPGDALYGRELGDLDDEVERAVQNA